MANAYDPQLVSLIISANIISGWADDTFIETNFNEPERMFFQVGAQGEVHPTVNRNETGYLKIFLKQSSLANDLLSNLFQTRSVFSWIMTDAASKTTIATSPASMIKSVPPISRGKTEKEVEWEIYCMKYIYKIGGIQR